jgi:hypothetical protein
MALPTHAPQPTQVWSKLVSNERHFTLEGETLPRPYLASYCSGVTQTLHRALHPHAPQSVQVWSKSSNNEGYFTLEGETVFRPCLASHCSGVTQTQYMALSLPAEQPLQGWAKSVKNEGHITYENESFTSLYCLALQRGDSKSICGTTCALATGSWSLVEMEL